MAAPTEMLRPAQQSLTGQVDANQLKVYTGIMLGAYGLGTEVAQMIPIRRIKAGKSFQEITFGHSDKGKRHVEGEDIMLDTGYRQRVPVDELELLIDKPRTINGVIPDWDIFTTHYETREKFLEEYAERHARDSDFYAYRTLVRAARSAANITAGGTSAEQRTPPGSSVSNVDGDTAPPDCTHANMKTDAAILRKGLKAASIRMDNNRCRKKGRRALISTEQYHELVDNRTLLDRDVTRDNGDFADGTVYKAYGIELVKVIGIADGQTDYAGATGENIDYTGDYTNNAGIVFCPGAARRLIRLSMEVDVYYWKPRKVWVLDTRMIDGWNVERPEDVVELATGA